MMKEFLRIILTIILIPFIGLFYIMVIILTLMNKLLKNEKYN